MYLEQWYEGVHIKSKEKRAEKEEKADAQGGSWKFCKSKQVWVLKNVYNLEKLPAKHFKMALPYLLSMHGMAKDRLRQQALKLLEDKEAITLDDLEQKLIDEAESLEEKEELKTKIRTAKVKRIERVAEKLASSEPN